MPSFSIASPAGKRRRSTTVGRILAAMVGLVIVSLGVPASAQQQRVDPTWLSFDTAAKTVRFELIAGLTGLNGALNFNGFRDGELTLTVPLGWTVVMHFWNHDGMLPHSAEVIEEAHPLPIQPVTPVFRGAVTVRLAEGLRADER